MKKAFIGFLMIASTLNVFGNPSANDYTTRTDVLNNSFKAYFRSFGIRALNCFNPSILSNTITPAHFNMNQPGASSDINTGIQIENTWSAYVNCNVIRKVGTSFHVSGVNTACIVYDNDFVKSYRGISVTNGGSLGVQGNIGRPSDNEWINNSTAMGSGQCVDDGTATQSILFVRTLPNSYNPVVLGPFVKNYCSNSLPIGPCVYPIDDDPSPLLYSINSELPAQGVESKGWNKKGIAKIIRQHPNWVVIDTTLSAFMDSISDKPSVLFDSVLIMQENEEYALASIINQQIVSEIDMDEIEKEINTYYLNLGSELSISNQINRIREIAQLCPFIYGEGVYKARILCEMFDPFNTLYINICEEATHEKAQENTPISDSEFNATLYPNPATEIITIAIESDESAFELIIYDNLGRIILQMKIDEAVTTIDISNFSAGLYSYMLQSAEGRVIFGKFSKTEN